MENIFYVYEWIRLDTNEPFYVGKGKGNRAFKFYRNRYFNNVVNKVGIENIAVSFLHENISEEEAFKYEIYYIDLYKNEYNYNLTNLTDGGEGVTGLIMSSEAKKKMKEHSARYWKGKKLPAQIVQKMKENNYWKGKIMPEEVRSKISNSRRGKYAGEKNHNFGKRFCLKVAKGEEHVYYGITREAHPAFGYRHTEEAKKKISESSKNRNHTGNSKNKISIANSGENNGMYGKTHSEETKLKLRNKKIKCKCKICNEEFYGKAWNSSKCDKCKERARN